MQSNDKDMEATAQPSDADEFIQWHPGFASALRMELRDNRDDLEFTEEELLSKKPMQIDVLVKRERDVQIKNQIGRIFRKYNLFEYKSPHDALTIDTFYKALGNAYHYKSQGEGVNARKAEEITVTLVREGYPRKLMEELAGEQWEIGNPYPGIYYVPNRFQTQVVVTSQLDEVEHLWLSVLRDNLREDEYRALLAASASLMSQEDQLLADSVLHVVHRANADMLKKLEGEDAMVAYLEELMKPKFEEKYNNGRQEGWQEMGKTVAASLYGRGFTTEEIADTVGMDVRTVKTWLGIV